ncbi:phosphatase PAP2 family protein [Rhodobacter sp. 24-YEA-8]|uniref:phosphatase PAP2 family protein n=1 Tax=Rhodobacter sp. 24-YEA-8 TaxID=1884310 RepID=UPI0008968817|nr:phosphatase PAP2 family protein [Rhodobacter sp. 24-YEA-8]SEB39438.1 PAP2 superfamily protein [Rhodobacter sp. 24-YEA-8]
MTAKPDIHVLPRQVTAWAMKALRPAEWLLLTLVLTLGTGCLALILAMGRIVEWSGFITGILASFGIIVVGACARIRSGAQRVGTAAIGVGLFMGFTALVTLFIYALFPLPRPMIDLDLMAVDAALGYDWAGFVNALAGWPLLGHALGLLYVSSLGQIIFVIILLSFLARETQLQRFLLVGMLTMIVAITVWWLWPSVGPSAWSQPEAEAAAQIGLIYTPHYGEVLLGLVREGPPVIRAQDIMGMVAFPSYHIVMAWMVAWYTRGTMFFLPLLAASLLMVPATLSHGAHHMVDLIAGSFVFLTCAWLAARLLPEPATRP